MSTKTGPPVSQRSRTDDIALDPPVARHADVVPAVEDRSYVIFIGGALVTAVAGGFVLAVVLSFAQGGIAWADRGPWLVQAHGWAQLQGWAGLFVAGMGFRLLPRFAGRRPLPRPVNVAVFIPLFAGVVLRTVAQPGRGEGISADAFLAGQLSWAVGALAFGIIVAVTLLRGRGGLAPWRVFAFAGAAWWCAWAVATVAAGWRARDDAYVPQLFDDAMTWMVMLGAIASFIWAVQSRSVPIFFGRKIPSFRDIAVPGLLLNVGAALFFAAAWMDNTSARDGVMAVASLASGAGLAWLAPIAGSCWGTPNRLRPRARAAARFVLVANLAAVVCGILLAWGGIASLIGVDGATFELRDSARHAFGLGVITILIVGMARLVAPFFALQRVEGGTAWLLDSGLLWLIAGAAVLRVASGLLSGVMDLEARSHLNAAAGIMAWVGLVIFAATVIRAIRAEPRLKASIATAARRPADEP